VQGKDKEQWMELCEQAAREQDHHELMGLVHKIDRLLAAKEVRLRPKQNPDGGETAPQDERAGK